MQPGEPVPSPFDRVWFGDVPVDIASMDEAVGRVIELSADDRAHLVVTPNVDHLVLQGSDPAVAAAYDEASLSLADGMPLILVSKVLRLPLTEKVSGADLVEPVAIAAAKAGRTMFFFGADDDTTLAAQRELEQLAPGLQVLGRTSPRYTLNDPDQPGIDDALEQIERTGADIVVMAFGCPKEQQLLHQYRDRLPAATYLCCGASLDFIAGRIERAPEWASRFGLEWLYRLAREPGRLWKRYLVRDTQALPIFARMTIARLRGRDLLQPAGTSR